MHSSGMRTASSLPYRGLCLGGLYPGGLYQGDLCQGCLCPGVSVDPPERGPHHPCGPNERRVKTLPCPKYRCICFAACIDYGSFAYSGLIFNDFNHSTCLPEVETTESWIKTTTLRVNPACVADNKVR